jgi:hypothetical protein
MKITIEAEYEFGDTVSTKVDPDVVGTVIAYDLRPGNVVLYLIQWGMDFGLEATKHYGMELMPSLLFKNKD